MAKDKYLSDCRPPLHYQPNTSLHRQLRQEAEAYLHQRDDHQFADITMVLKTLFFLLISAVFWWLCLQQSSIGWLALCYIIFIFSSMLLALNAVHDASHNAFFPWRVANTLLNYILCIPLGIDPNCWRVRHVFLHHGYINIQHYDLDIDENGFLRQTPYQRWYCFMRWQHLYWPLIAAMTFPYIIWVFDFQDRLGITRVKADLPQQGARGWLLFLVGKGLHVTLALVIPWYYAQIHGINGSVIIVFYLLAQMLSSLVFVLLILGTHWARAKFYPVPEQSVLDHNWYQHIFATSCDWQTSPKLLGYWLGGINLHLTHHLFPGWSHRHYPALADIIGRVAEQHGEEYYCLSLHELFAAQQRFLRAMGNPNLSTR